MTLVRRGVIGVILVLGGLSAGCGYRTGELYRTSVETVHVEIFDSREFRRDLEFLLTEAIKKRILTDTPYRLAPRARADTILKGELIQEGQSAFAPDFATRLPRDVQLTLIARVEWKDLQTGELLVERPVLLQSTDYLPSAGESEAFGQRRAIDRLAARIVAQMARDDW